MGLFADKSRLLFRRFVCIPKDALEIEERNATSPGDAAHHLAFIHARTHVRAFELVACSWPLTNFVFAGVAQ